MPRTRRHLIPSSFYHIMARGNNKNKVFKTPSDYYLYISLIKKYKKELPFNLFHYCLMPNHIHMLIQTKSADDFSLFMKKISLAYFHYFRKKYGWVGHFWQDRFKSQPVGNNEYFIQCGKYIELNPVRAGLVKSPEEYYFSSYRFYSQGVKNDLITEDINFQQLGKTIEIRRKKYINLILSNIILEKYKDKVWGTDSQKYNETRKIKRHDLTK